MFEKEIAKGMAWLDETIPGWWKKINLDWFNIKSPCSCVLGQVFDGMTQPTMMFGYDYALSRYGIDPKEYGFCLSGICDEWSILDQEWIEAIRQRQQRPIDKVNPEKQETWRDRPSLL